MKKNVLHNKNIIAYILVNFLINVKIKINCKTGSYFFYVQHGGLHLDL